MADEVEIVNPAIAGAIQESIRDEKGRIKPGFSLNPDGKKPGTLHFKTLLLDGLKEIGAKNQRGEDISNDVVIVKKLMESGKGGNLTAINMIMDRVDGKPQGEAPTNVNINVVGLTEEQMKKLDELV
jgi:hypothetical protein